MYGQWRSTFVNLVTGRGIATSVGLYFEYLIILSPVLFPRKLKKTARKRKAESKSKKVEGGRLRNWVKPKFPFLDTAHSGISIESYPSQPLSPNYTGSTITNIWVLKLTHKNLKIFHALDFQNTISLTPSPPFIMVFWNRCKSVFNLVLETIIKMQWTQKAMCN